MAHEQNNSGVAPPNFDTPVGKVRLLLGDTSPHVADGEQTGEYLWYSDSEIESLLALYEGSPKRTAIYIWRLIAMTPAMQLKKWSSADLSVDGAAITRAIRETIRDIERSINADEDDEVSAIFSVIPTGAPLLQPALRQRDPIRYRGEETDPSVPLRIV